MDKRIRLDNKDRCNLILVYNVLILSSILKIMEIKMYINCCSLIDICVPKALEVNYEQAQARTVLSIILLSSSCIAILEHIYQFPARNSTKTRTNSRFRN